MATTGKPRFYFSLRSPYSWLALHDMTHRYPDALDRLEWIPFWEPDERSMAMLQQARGRFVYSPMSREKHMYILKDVRRLAAERGLEVAWPVDRDPVWEVPHLAYLLAEEQGQGRRYIERMSRARWQEARDICDPETVRSVAVELGLDGDRLAGASEDPEVRQAGLAPLLSVFKDGVFGVPFFIQRRDAYWGLDRLPAFMKVIGVEPVDARTPAGAPSEDESCWSGDGAFAAEADELVLVHTAEASHAGGCG